MLNVIDGNQELRAAYVAMIQGEGWKDLMRKLKDEKEAKFNALMLEGGEKKIDETRGFIKALEWLEQETGFILDRR